MEGVECGGVKGGVDEVGQALFLFIVLTEHICLCILGERTDKLSSLKKYV
jgi:hypothetical protein